MPRTLARTALAAVLALVMAAGGVLGAAPRVAAAEEVLREDFGDGVLPEGWRPVEGGWEVVDGRLVGTSTGGQLSRITFGPHLEHVRISATVEFLSRENAGRWAALGLDLAADGRVPWQIATMRSGTRAANGIEFAQRTTANTWNVTDTAAAPSDAGVGQPVRIAAEIRGGEARWEFDGQEVLRTRAIRRSVDGGLGLVLNGARVAFDDVVVERLDPPSLIRPDEPGATPAVIAHRGASAVTPENTMAAVQLGRRVGADYVEIDAQTTADGVPVVMHDGTVDRTTDGSGAISSLTRAQIRALDAGSWFGPDFAGERVPTLGETLDVLRGTGTTMLLEVKGPETRAEVAGILAEVTQRGMAGQVLLQSFDVQVLRDAAELAPEVPLGLLRGALDADPVAVARDLGVVAYNPSAAPLLARPEVIADLHAAGVAVMPYTVDNAGQWAQLEAVGVDGIITNRPGALVGWNERFRQDPPAPAVPVTVEILAPVDGAPLGRHESPQVALRSTGAGTTSITVDGVPIAEGDRIDLTELPLGETTVEVTATGEGGTATDAATLTLEATPEGLAVLLAGATDASPGIRQQLFSALAREDWDRLASAAERGAVRGLDPALAALIEGDARALAADG